MQQDPAHNTFFAETDQVVSPYISLVMNCGVDCVAVNAADSMVDVRIVRLPLRIVTLPQGGPNI